VITGADGSIKIDGERVLLTDHDGVTEDLSVADVADDSYHPAWFGGVAAEFEQAIKDGPDSAAVMRNLAEARTSISVIELARKSSQRGGEILKMPASF